MRDRTFRARAHLVSADDLYAEMLARYGAIPNSLRVLAASPAALVAWRDFQSGLEDSELVRQQVAEFTVDGERCGYRLATTSTIGVAALEFATAVVRDGGAVSDEAIAAARSAGLTDAQLVEVVAVVTANTLLSLADRLAPSHGST